MNYSPTGRQKRQGRKECRSSQSLVDCRENAVFSSRVWHVNFVDDRNSTNSSRCFSLSGPFTSLEVLIANRRCRNASNLVGNAAVRRSAGEARKQFVISTTDGRKGSPGMANMCILQYKPPVLLNSHLAVAHARNGANVGYV